MNRNLTAEGTAQLQEGINVVLSRWAALRMAVENEWGGRESFPKSQQLSVDLFRLLTQSREKVYIEDVEDMLDEFMLTLNTEIEDDSLEEIAETLMVMHEECSEGNYDSIRKLRLADIPNLSYTREASDDEEDSEDDDGDGDDTLRKENFPEREVDTPEFQSSFNEKVTLNDNPSPSETPEVEDGWTVVSSRRSRGRKN